MQSLMILTSNPTACSDLIAVSRPEPGPFTKTSTRFIPCSIAFRAHASAAICAANGVPFFVPLKPTVPALPHDTTSPFTSVMDMMVLLNVDWIWAIPWAIFFFSLGFGLPAVFFANFRIPPYFFLFAPTVRLGPLRVRALVLVR